MISVPISMERGEPFQIQPKCVIISITNKKIMRKINTTTYKVTVRIGNTETREVDYGVKDSIIEMLFGQGLKLTAVELLKQNKLAGKVAEAGDELLLEEEEYTRVKSALEVLAGLGKNDIEFVKRILEAETVEVAEK